MIAPTLRGIGVAALLVLAAVAARAAGPVTVPATIQPFFATDLYSKISGYVAAVNADLGDHVRRGQVLAVIDDPELRARLVGAEATLDSKRGAASAAAASLERAKAAANVARHSLAALRAQQSLARANRRREEQLYAGKAVTAQQIDQVRAEAAVASDNVNVGEAKLGLAEAEVKLAAAKEMTANAEILMAAAEVTRLSAVLEYTKIVAPFDCTITSRTISPGMLVTAAATLSARLFTCQDLDVVRVAANVPEAEAAEIKPGWQAEVKLLAGTAPPIRAAVTRIATAVDPTSRTMAVEIDLPNADAKLRPGMYAEVTLRPPPKVGAR